MCLSLLRPWRGALFVAGSALFATACGGGEPAPPAVPERPPHVLLVVMDTTRGDHCSLLGYERETTPSLSAFAGEAVSYSDAWVPGGWTAPTHASMFTGQRAPRHGVLGDLHEARAVLRPSAVTLAELLRDAGYATACLSENPVVGPVYGLAQGFSYLPPIHLDARRSKPFAADTHRRALDFLQSADDEGRPAFVYVNDFEAHLPYAPLERVQARFVPDGVADSLLAEARAWNNPLTIELLLGLRTESEGLVALLPDLYDAEVATVDEELGRLFSEMERRGLLDRTLVIVTSDHGENLGDHGLWDHRFSLHRSIRHVPLVVRHPKFFTGGKTVADVVRIEDLMPTVLDVCGLPLPTDLDGVSLLEDTAGRLSRASYGAHLGELQTMQRHRDDADETLYRSTIRAVYDGRHHLIVSSTGETRLFDVGSDPGEEKDLAPERPDVVERLRVELDP